MSRQETIKSRKAKLVFPNLVPQCELERNSSSAFRSLLRFDRAGEQARTPENEAPAPLGETVDFEATTLSVRNFHKYGDLYARYLRARRDVFIVEKGWNLPETDGMEFDQYDTPLARWIALHTEGEILGGARISPTTAQCGSHSYMLRDAQLGLLPGLPEDLLYEAAPVQKNIWEASRLFITASVPSEKRLHVQSILLREMAAAARSVGATHIIGIVPAVFKRWLKRIGMTATEVGPVKTIAGDKVQAALMNVIDYSG